MTNFRKTIQLFLMDYEPTGRIKCSIDGTTDDIFYLERTIRKTGITVKAKGTDFDMITNKQIKYVEDWINNRPMKVLGYLTHNEKFQELIYFYKCCV